MVLCFLPRRIIYLPKAIYQILTIKDETQGIKEKKMNRREMSQEPCAVMGGVAAKR